ncbi:MAG: Holliday junction branch migration protein RuvA, partial [Negativicutes bacterium]|nr:Holliday junction branch migration protein RuvA [Negativicutes bacterium]
MIGYLSGEVIAVESDSCLLVVGGVGYQVHLPQRYLQELAA